MDRIKLLGICGSPRKDANSQFLLEAALEAAAAVVPGAVETELFSIAGKVYTPCDGCDQCHKRLGYCRQTDDDFAELRDKWFAADAIIYSVPIYHLGVPGQLKSFIDRLGNSTPESFNSRLLKVIAVLTQGSGMSTGQEHVMQFLNGHATMQGCIPVGGVWPGGYLGVGTWTRANEDRDALRKYLEAGESDVLYALDSIKELSKHVVHLALILRAGGRALEDMLREDGGFEFFLRQLEAD